jgi:hypothetical protein
MGMNPTSSDSLQIVGKNLNLNRLDIDGYKQRLFASAKHTQKVIRQLASIQDSTSFLATLKFNAIGCDPLNAEKPLNLIEQLNQTFTYLASFQGAEFLFSRHPDIPSLQLNLGTSSGFDIESDESGGLVAEVFAAVTPKNNQKLTKDCKRVAESQAKHRYVLFMSPKCPQAGPYPYKAAAQGVSVWSMGYPLT